MRVHGPGGGKGSQRIRPLCRRPDDGGHVRDNGQQHRQHVQVLRHGAALPGRLGSGFPDPTDDKQVIYYADLAAATTERVDGADVISGTVGEIPLEEAIFDPPAAKEDDAGGAPPPPW